MLEYLGALTGFICVWLAARNSLWNFPVTIVSVLIYMMVFYQAKLYADMGLQVYFLFMAIYGWYFWINRRGDDQKLKPIRRISPREIGAGIIVVALFTFLVGKGLYLHTDAFFPYLDSFCTGGSLFGAFLLSRRVMENWVVWIIVDIVYLYLYIAKELYVTTLLYLVFVGVAVFGYLEWKKLWKTEQLK